MSDPSKPKDIAELALFGGHPTFQRVRPIGQLATPDPARFQACLEAAVAHESGRGPSLIPQLERELGEFHGVEHCVTFSNACVALIALTELLGRVPGGEVILPAFTYMGLPHLVQWTGHRPRFCDVLPDEHTLDPAAVREALGPNTALILGVHQVQAACQVEEFASLSEEFDLPVIYDAVHGLYNTHRGKPIGRFGEAEVFSLHATKLLNGFEGGYVTTCDGDLTRRLRVLRDGGRSAGGAALQRGWNGQLPEFHAALALAGLEDLPRTAERNRARYERYRATFQGIPGVRVLEYPLDGEQRNYEFTLVWVDPEFGFSRDEVVEILMAEGTRTRAYYGPAVHQTEHRPQWMAEPSLPVTEQLAKHLLQMPVGEHVSLEDIDRIGEIFRALAGARSEARKWAGAIR